MLRMTEHEERKDVGFQINVRKHNIALLLFIVLIFVLVVPQFVRFFQGNVEVVGSESHLSLRYAQELIDYKGLTTSELVEQYSATPDLVYTKRTFHFTPYHVLLAFLGNLFGLGNVAHILPLILGLLSVLLFGAILVDMGYTKFKTRMTLLLLVVSPAFVYAFTFSTSHSLAILLSLLSIYLFLRKNIIFLILSILCAVIVSLFSMFNIILLMLVLVAVTLNKEDKRSWAFASFIVTGAFMLFKHVNLYYSYTTHDSANFISSLFSDLGGLIGFGFVPILLAFLGFGALWKKRRQLLVFIIPILIVVSYIFVGEGFFMYLAFFVAIAAAEGFMRLSDGEWSLPLLKTLTLILVICGVIFSMISYVDRIVESDPGPMTMHSLELLQKSSKAGEIVLTHPDYGYWVESIADRKVLADSLSTDNYNQKFLYKVADSIFESRNLEEATTLLRTYNIRYIWITPEMKSGLVWDKEDEGLLFLLENSETFKKTYSTYDYDIWEVLPPIKDSLKTSASRGI